MENKEEGNITPQQQEETWKFRSREVLISEMDELSVLKAAIHAMKRIYYYNNRYHYAEYRIKTADDDRERAKYERVQKKADDLVIFFADKLEHLEEQALKLGFEIPEKYEELKKLLSKVEAEHENKEE